MNNNNLRNGSLPRDIKKKNTSEIFRAMMGERDFSASYISEKTHISRLTVSKVIEEFCDMGIVIPVGKGNSTKVGGKRPNQYALNNKKYVIVVLGTIYLPYYGLLSLDGTVRITYGGRVRHNYDYNQYIEILANSIDKTLFDNSIESSDVLGIILANGGIIADNKRVVFNSNNPEWGNNLNIADDLKKQLKHNTDVYVENAAKIAANAFSSCDKFIGKKSAVLFVDYGISIVLMEDGKVLESAHNVTGELGHMCLEPSDDVVCGCGSKGCFESLISHDRMLSIIQKLPKKKKDEFMANYNGKDDIRTYILEEEKKGSEVAEQLSDYLAKYVGLALRNVYLAYDPSIIAIVGNISNGSEAFFNKIKKIITENRYLKDVEIDFEIEKRKVIEVISNGGTNMILHSTIKGCEE